MKRLARKLRLWLKRSRCPHTRMARFYPDDVTWRNILVKDSRPERHGTVVVEGCLNCGRMWMRDYGE